MAVREVAIHISNHTTRVGDRGVVVIGGSVDLGDLAHQGDEGEPCNLLEIPEHCDTQSFVVVSRDLVQERQSGKRIGKLVWCFNKGLLLLQGPSGKERQSRLWHMKGCKTDA